VECVVELGVEAADEVLVVELGGRGVLVPTVQEKEEVR
jgi:hypothetical protein